MVNLTDEVSEEIMEEVSKYPHLYIKKRMDNKDLIKKKFVEPDKQLFKGAQSYLNKFFPNFWRFCYHKKAHIFLTTHGKF